MARKAKDWTEVKLRQAIGEAIYSRHLQSRRIDREAIKARYLGKNPKQAEFIKRFVDRSQTRRLPTGASASATQLYPIAIPRATGGSGGDASSPDMSVCKVEFLFLSPCEHSLITIEFKDHLAGNLHRRTSDIAHPSPSLELQWQFLATSDDKEEAIRDPLLTEHVVLISPLVESRGCSLPSQYALLGKITTAGSAIPDVRVMLNTNIPFSAFVCGVQGSGKSHTTACIIENCSMTMPALGTLKKSISTLVLQFDEYSSTVSSQPSEAAFLARVMPQYAQEQPVPLRVLVSPTNFNSLKKMYSLIPNIEVRPFKIQPKHVNISMMLSLMSLSQSGAIPLYMAQVTRVLRDMAMESGGYFDYSDFRVRLDALELTRSQTPFLYQRLDLLDSYLDIAGKTTGDYFIDGGVTILDLSCPFVDQSTACILFRIAIELFLHAHPSRGKMIVADEAHKYMTDTPAAKVLTETFMTIIRQQRHLGVRTIISTQEPTISPRLLDLCSLTIIHRFTSPEWYKTIEKHVPMDSENTRQHSERIPDGFYQIASLRTGEAIVFASSAHLVGEDGAVIDTKHRTFKMVMRTRVTWDGGKTIVCIR
ncbi:hypothetical protein BDW59DRAFT_180079 [Aspergillus cavernicola]|uniref:P-loop containing nucleoside triphosphate hydrolase protein n=1 Tax=Aspergillus cavernicola TaxID=176166 RepID=A0ABR4J0G7_9EURO